MSHPIKTVLITGGARRIGAVIAEYLHQQGFRVVIHCNHSMVEAEILAEKLNANRPDSACVYKMDLRKIDKLPDLVKWVIDRWQRLDVLVHNASAFYPTDLASVNESDWDDLMQANAKAPFFLSQAAYSYLKETQGHIINITDIHAEKPLKDYGIYTMSKALLLHQTQCLAGEWGPEIRVNAVAPGAVLWPEGENSLSETVKQKILNKATLKKQVNPESIAKAVMFLLENEDITGEVIHVSAGRVV